MQFSYVLSCTAIVGAVTAVPLAELERRYKGTPMEKWTMPGLGERAPALVPRMPSGGRHRSSTITPIKPPRLARNQVRPEDYYDYQSAISSADKYPAGQQWPRSTWRTSTPEDEDDALYYRGNSRGGTPLVEMYVGKKQPFTEQNARDVIRQNPVYKDAYLSSRGGGGSRKKTIDDIRKTPLYAQGTDKDEFPSISRDYPPGAFGVGRVPRVESKYQSQMLTEADRAYPGNKLLVVPNYKDNPRSDRPMLRGYKDDVTNPPYEIPRVSRRDAEAYLGPMSVPVSGKPRGHRRSASPPMMVTAPLVRSRSLAPSRRSRRIIYDSDDDRRRKRDLGENGESDLSERDIIGQINGQEQNATSSTTADLQTMTNQWLFAFDDARDNATALLEPFIVDLLNGTNSPLGEAMAWGLYSMTLPAVAITGPFLGNSSRFGLDSASNSSIVPPGDDWSSWASDVDDFYLTYYNEAYNAVNETGLLRELELLASAIASVNTTMLPEDETTIMDHTIEPFIPFLQSMYEYNGFDFTPSNSTNNTDQYTVNDPNMSINFVDMTDPSGVFIFGYSDGAQNMTQLEQTAKALNLTIDFPTNGSTGAQNSTMQRRGVTVLM